MILYPDQFPVDNFMQRFREESGDPVGRIKRLYGLLEEFGLAASIWETKIELYDDPLNVLRFPDGVKRLIIKFTKPANETAADLICTWCSPRYLDIYRLEEEHVVGTRANASELHRDSPYRLWPRHLLPLDEMSKMERDIYHCSDHLGHTVNQCLPACLQMFNLPDDIVQMPVFHGLKIDGDNKLFGIRCALMFIDESMKMILAINDRIDDGREHELMANVFAAKQDPSVLSRYIFYLEVDLIVDDLDLDELLGFDELLSQKNDEKWEIGV